MTVAPIDASPASVIHLMKTAYYFMDNCHYP